MHSSTIEPIRRGRAVLRTHGMRHTARPAQMPSIAVLCRFARRIDPRGARRTPLQMPAVTPIRPTTAEGGAAVPRGGLGGPADNGRHLRGMQSSPGAVPRAGGRCSGPPGPFRATRDMHDAPIGARRRSRGLSRMPHMPHTPRPTRIAPNGAPRMLREPPRAGNRPHPSPGASRRTQSAGDTDAR